MKERPLQADFSAALRAVWTALGNPPDLIDDECFKQPTLLEVEERAAELQVHPLTLLLLAYCSNPESFDPMSWELADLTHFAANEVRSLFPVPEPTCAEDMR